jgi:hypothetical protein
VPVPPCQHGLPRCHRKDAGNGGNTCATPHEAWVSPFVHDSRHSRISQVEETGQRRLKITPKRAQASDPKSSHHIGIEEPAFNAPRSRGWTSRGVSKQVLREARLFRSHIAKDSDSGWSFLRGLLILLGILSIENYIMTSGQAFQPGKVGSMRTTVVI